MDKILETLEELLIDFYKFNTAIEEERSKLARMRKYERESIRLEDLPKVAAGEQEKDLLIKEIEALKKELGLVCEDLNKLIKTLPEEWVRVLATKSIEIAIDGMPALQFKLTIKDRELNKIDFREIPF